MRILIAEYAVGTSSEQRSEILLAEGKAMLEALKRSFEKIGNEVIYPIGEKDFEGAVEKLSRGSDAAIVIAPDEMLYEVTKIVESNTVNLGCPSRCVKICADKKKTTEILEENGIRVPRVVGADEVEEEGVYVVKPRYGCASEDVFVVRGEEIHSLEPLIGMDDKRRDFIITDFIQGEDISSSIIRNKISSVVLSINKQFIKRDKKRLLYEGGLVPYSIGEEAKEEVIEMSKKVAAILGCEGYVGIDFVLADDGEPYVIEVNPRPTTSIVGIAKVLNYEIAELIIRARYGEDKNLPSEEEIKMEGSFVFK
ncbi:MAG: ATP-grasp domain-containing protein, partial [Candidatus Methanospirareceae archaeon]